MDSVPGKGTVEFVDVLVAEDAPEAIARSELGIERDWGVEPLTFGWGVQMWCMSGLGSRWHFCGVEVAKR